MGAKQAAAKKKGERATVPVPKVVPLGTLDESFRKEAEKDNPDWKSVNSLLDSLDAHLVYDKKGTLKGWEKSSSRKVDEVGGIFHGLYALHIKAEDEGEKEAEKRLSGLLALYGYKVESRATERRSARSEMASRIVKPPKFPLYTVVPSKVVGKTKPAGPVRLGTDIMASVSDDDQIAAEADLGLAVTAAWQGASPSEIGYQGKVIDVLLSAMSLAYGATDSREDLLSGNWSEGARVWLSEQFSAGSGPLSDAQIKGILNALNEGRIIDALNMSEGTTFGETLITGVEEALKGATTQQFVFLFNLGYEDPSMARFGSSDLYIGAKGALDLYTLEERKASLVQGENGFEIRAESTGKYREKVGGRVGPILNYALDPDNFQNVQLTLLGEYTPDPRGLGGRAIVTYNDQRGKLQIFEMPLYYYVEGEAGYNQKGIEMGAGAGGMIGLVDDVRFPFAVGVNYKFTASTPRFGGEGQTNTHTLVPRLSLGNMAGNLLVEAPIEFRQEGPVSYGVGAFFGLDCGIKLLKGLQIGASAHHTGAEGNMPEGWFFAGTLRYYRPPRAKPRSKKKR